MHRSQFYLPEKTQAVITAAIYLFSLCLSPPIAVPALEFPGGTDERRK
jgi:hypothetical protein